jgi:ribosome-associated protein
LPARASTQKETDLDIRKKQRAVVEALEDIKGRDIVVFNTERLSPIFERVVIACGDSTRQVKSLADNVAAELKKIGCRVYGVEGGDTGEWVLVDLGDIVVHVMHPTTRAFYNLEEIWGGKEVKMKRAAPRESAASRARP